MPATEAALPRFRAADTQVLGVSIDSVHCHANWGRDLGGVSFPLLADFHPKGAVASAFGHYLADVGITDRATVIVDKTGTVRYSVSVTPGGVRDIDALVAECEKINGGSSTKGDAPTLPAGTTLFVKSNCAASRRALAALANLRLHDAVVVRNVSEDAAAKADLIAAGGKDQAPCLVCDGKARYEAAEITVELANRTAPLLG